MDELALLVGDFLIFFSSEGVGFRLRLFKFRSWLPCRSLWVRSVYLLSCPKFSCTGILNEIDILLVFRLEERYMSNTEMSPAFDTNRLGIEAVSKRSLFLEGLLFGLLAIWGSSIVDGYFNIPPGSLFRLGLTSLIYFFLRRGSSYTRVLISLSKFKKSFFVCFLTGEGVHVKTGYSCILEMVCILRSMKISYIISLLLKISFELAFFMSPLFFSVWCFLIASILSISLLISSCLISYRVFKNFWRNFFSVVAT